MPAACAGIRCTSRPARAKLRHMNTRRLHAPDAPESAATPEKFEVLLARLEKIVSDMETADLPLENLLSSYEEGMRLVKACGEKLADADQKIEVLSKSISTAGAKMPAPAETSSPAKEPEEDIRLF